MNHGVMVPSWNLVCFICTMTLLSSNNVLLIHAAENYCNPYCFCKPSSPDVRLGNLEINPTKVAFYVQCEKLNVTTSVYRNESEGIYEPNESELIVNKELDGLFVVHNLTFDSQYKITFECENGSVSEPPTSSTMNSGTSTVTTSVETITSSERTSSTQGKSSEMISSAPSGMANPLDDSDGEKFTFSLEFCTAIERPGKVFISPENQPTFNSVKLNWKHPDNVRTSRVGLLSYTIHWKSSRNNGHNSHIGSNINETEYEISSLIPGTEYDVTITPAFLVEPPVDGELTQFSVVTLTGSPEAPRNITAVVVGGNKIEVRWQRGAYVGPQNDTVVMHQSWDCLLFPSAGRKQTFGDDVELKSVWEGLQGGSCYRFTITAVTSAGQAEEQSDAVKINEQENGNNTGAIIGATVGSVLFVLVVAGLLFYFRRKIRKSLCRLFSAKTTADDTMGQTETPGGDVFSMRDDPRGQQPDRVVEENHYEQPGEMKNAPKGNDNQNKRNPAPMTIEEIDSKLSQNGAFDQHFNEVKSKKGRSRLKIGKELQSFEVKGLSGPTEYLVTNAPFLPSGNLNEIWSVIWEKSITVVVMLTKESEYSVPKCARYWPEKDKEQEFGEIYVTNTYEAHERGIYFEREFVAKQGNAQKKIRHFQVTDWSSKGCPKKDMVIDIVKNVRSSCDGNYKLLVHCSDDFDRTEYFLTVDYAIEILKYNSTPGNNNRKVLDINDFILHMQQIIPAAITDKERYVSIYECIAHYWKTSLLQSEAACIDADKEHIYDDVTYPQASGSGRNDYPTNPAPAKPYVKQRLACPPVPTDGPPVDVDNQQAMEEEYVDLHKRKRF